MCVKKVLSKKNLFGAKKLKTTQVVVERNEHIRNDHAW
jgi:hypothetical protein